MYIGFSTTDDRLSLLGVVSLGKKYPVCMNQTRYRFMYRRISVYFLAQLMGGLVGAALVYANYIHAIDLFEGGRHVRTLNTASLFSTYSVSLFHDESPVELTGCTSWRT